MWKCGNMEIVDYQNSSIGHCVYTFINLMHKTFPTLLTQRHFHTRSYWVPHLQIFIFSHFHIFQKSLHRLPPFREVTI